MTMTSTRSKPKYQPRAIGVDAEPYLSKDPGCGHIFWDILVALIKGYAMVVFSCQWLC